MAGVDGFDELLETAHQPGLHALRGLLRRVLARYGSSARLVGEQKLLRSRVYRLRFVVDGQPRSVIAKRFQPDRALRERVALTRWLPAAGLGAHVPALLGTAAESTGHWIWHVYEDLGDWGLDRGPFDPARIEAAIDLIARFHVRFAGHRLLGEIRSSGGNLGAGFFSACVHDAATALRAVCPPTVDLSPEHWALRDRLLRRLEVLEQERHVRTVTMAEAGAVETLLHGDLWSCNVMVLPPDGGGLRPVRIIDWDHAGVGPIVYDLSTLLTQFDLEKRPMVLDLYRAAVAREVRWQLPDNDRLNHLFETCEYARLANALLWPAIAASEPSPAWAFEDMATIERWFESLEPVLP
jgi:hypothetical protein